MKTFIALLTALSILTSPLSRVLPYPNYASVELKNFHGEGSSTVSFSNYTASSYTSYAGEGAVLVSSTCYYAFIDDEAMIYYAYDNDGNGGTNKNAYTYFDFYDTVFTPLRIVSLHTIQAGAQTWTAYTSDGI